MVPLFFQRNSTYFLTTNSLFFKSDRPIKLSYRKPDKFISLKVVPKYFFFFRFLCKVCPLSSYQASKISSLAPFNFWRNQLLKNLNLFLKFAFEKYRDLKKNSVSIKLLIICSYMFGCMYNLENCFIFHTKKTDFLKFLIKN